MLRVRPSSVLKLTGVLLVGLLLVSAFRFQHSPMEEQWQQRLRESSRGSGGGDHDSFGRDLGVSSSSSPSPPPSPSNMQGESSTPSIAEDSAPSGDQQEQPRPHHPLSANDSDNDHTNVIITNSNASAPLLPPQHFGDHGFDPSTTAILIFTYDRSPKLRRNLEGVLRSRELARRSAAATGVGGRGQAQLFFPIIVAQEGDDPEVNGLLQEFAPHLLRVMRHTRQSFVMRSAKDRWKDKYWGISQHFKDALPAVLDGTASRMTGFGKYRMTEIYSPQQLGPLSVAGSPEASNLVFNHILVIEDDLTIAEDFVEYFWAMGYVLQRDPTLMCVSAWNDNGQPEWVQDPTVVRRTDFFPGLGWMFGRQHFESWIKAPRSLRQGWPDLLWDEWLRYPQRRQDRQCLYPEISRSGHPILEGERPKPRTPLQILVDRVLLNQEYVHWMTRQTTEGYLRQLDPVANVQRLRQAVSEALPVPSNSVEQLRENLPQLLAQLGPGQGFVFFYRDKTSFSALGRALGSLSDLPVGIPRSGLAGIVELKWTETPGHPVYLAPPPSHLSGDFYQRCVTGTRCLDGSFW